MSLSGIVARARSLWLGVRRRTTVEADMNDEFRLHLELRAADLVRSGLSIEAAKRQARLEFGSTERYKEQARRMLRNLHLEGPLGSCRRVLEEMIADIDNGLRVEEEGFTELIGDSAVSLDDIRRRSYGGWYLNAAQALDLRLVGGLV